MIPKEGTVNWWTFLGLIDTRLDLTKSSALFSYLPQVGTLKTVFGVNLLELLLMASKIAYENAAVVEYAVTQRWKVGFWFLLGDALKDSVRLDQTESNLIQGEKLSPYKVSARLGLSRSRLI